MAEQKTLIGVDCDPLCEYKLAVARALEKRYEALQSVPQAPYQGVETDIRPTPEGYAQQEQIWDEYAGLDVLEQAGKTCVKACAIEGLAASSRTFGSEVQVMINNLRGE